MPMTMASAVIITGRKRPAPAASAASVEFMPSLQIEPGKGDDQDGIGRGHAQAHDRAHQRGNAHGGDGEEERPDHAGQRAGQGGDDDEWIEPALEIDHQQQINQGNGADQSKAQPRRSWSASLWPGRAR